jgi:CD209 antigen
MRYEGLRWVSVLLLLACSSPHIELGGGRPQEPREPQHDSGARDAMTDPPPATGAADAATIDSSLGDASDPTAELDAGAVLDAGPVDSPVALGEPPDDSCTGEVFERHAYWFCTDAFDWDAARDACRAIGADLVSVQSAEDQAFLDQHTGSEQWILGARRVEGDLLWVDGTALGFTQWDRGQPGSLDCLFMESGLWRTGSCSDNESWICELR